MNNTPGTSFNSVSSAMHLCRWAKARTHSLTHPAGACWATNAGGIRLDRKVEAKFRLQIRTF